MFPPTFIEETVYGSGYLLRGYPEGTQLRRIRVTEQNMLDMIFELLK
jgi:hypothetical protein